MKGACAAIKASGGNAVPTVKPWDVNTLKEKFALVADADPYAVAMGRGPRCTGPAFPAEPESACRGQERELRQVVMMPLTMKGLPAILMTWRSSVHSWPERACSGGSVVHGPRLRSQIFASIDIPGAWANTDGGAGCS